MANTISLLTEERIQYEGLFDLKELYKHAWNWLVWRKFNVAEDRYTEKVKAAGKEMKIDWTATKNIDEYSKFEIKVRWEMQGITDVEVKKNGGTAKMNKGEVNIYITASVITDRQDYWAQNVFFSFMRGFYDRYIYRSTLERLKGEVWKLGWEYFNELKAFLQLYRY
ncbi:MAG: hypothetical protein QW063_01700 [Candidatus Nanoarchaeia archaeon]